MLPILTVKITSEPDVVLARQRARQLARLVGFDAQDQTRIATAVSEIARNAYVYAGGGHVEFLIEGQTAPQLFAVRVVDQGPGIPHLDVVLSGQYQSSTGMGLGLVGARRLMDVFDVDSTPGCGTTVVMRKLLPRRTPLVTAAGLPSLLDALAATRSDDPLTEVRSQNQELLRTLDELRRRQLELARLNGELEDTNRGVVALYAELDEKADHLRRADELKSRFLSNMSHEFRTPLNSILALSRILLAGSDGPLTAEQARQVQFVRKAADELLELVNDLLDLAKVEAGKIVVRPGEFTVDRLFGALRGMLRPLLLNPALDLVFDDAGDLPPVVSDESKVSQILRNFLSNALKFTERGEIRVGARVEGSRITFTVRDTGIGIAPEDQETIFKEFNQLDHPLQRRVRGTGLGLPLSRRLAELLGGHVGVESTVGVGSTFSLTLPLVYVPAAPGAAADVATRDPYVEWRTDPGRIPILVVDDAAETLLLYQGFVRGTGFELVPARTVPEARQLLKTVRPAAIVLDIPPTGEDGWAFLAELKSDDARRDIPVMVVTEVNDEPKARALGAAAYARKPVDSAAFLDGLRALVGPQAGKRILIIDDDDDARYLLRSALREMPYVVSEASSGLHGLERARTEHPDLIFCDLRMPGVDGAEVLRMLREDPATRDIPVVVNTVRQLTPGERAELERAGAAVISKEVFATGTAAAEIRRVLTRAGVAV